MISLFILSFASRPVYTRKIMRIECELICINCVHTELALSQFKLNVDSVKPPSEVVWMRIGSGLKSKTRLCRHFARNACEARLQGASLEASLHLKHSPIQVYWIGETRWQVLHELGQRMTKRELPIRTREMFKADYTDSIVLHWIVTAGHCMASS